MGKLRKDTELVSKFLAGKIYCWQNVLMKKCLTGKNSCWQNVWVEKCLAGKISYWQTILMLTDIFAIIQDLCQIVRTILIMLFCSNFSLCINIANLKALVSSIKNANEFQQIYAGCSTINLNCYHI